MRAAVAVLCSASVGVLLGASPAMAQHATAHDVEDGARAFQSSCANCHGPDGDLIPGIDLGRGKFLRPLSDEELAGIIRNGLPNTPMPATPGMSEEQALEIVAYLRSTAASKRSVTAGGDAERGKAIFDGTGQCMDCHRVAGRGSRVGPDLSRIGSQRRAVELEQSLLDPAAEVRPENRSYSVTTTDGEKVTGRLLNHDTFTVQLIDSGERLRSFQMKDLRAHGFVPTPMPSYRGRLDEHELADVIAYLVSLRGPAQP